MIRLFLLALVCVGCTVTGKGDREVTERSKGRRPIWTDIAPGQFIEVNGHLQMLTIKRTTEELTSKIREAQKGAQNLGRVALVSEINDRVAQLAADNQIKVVNTDVAQNVISDTIDSSFQTIVGVADIYYEKVKSSQFTDDDLREYYEIYVLTDCDEGRLNEVVANLGNRFERLAFADLRELGSALKTDKTSAKLLAH